MNSKSNTFKFKSFSERVTEIDIRRAALYHIGHENEEPEDCEETYFHQTLKKWTVLNLTEEFNEFQKRCSNIVTLPQLIHKKDFIVDFLLEKLSTATTLSLQPLLECIVVLGKDLREEFYPYFQRILDRLICLLNTKDADQLEWTLICLAFLFKTLKPYLKKNLTIVFNSVLPLLDDQQYSDDIINFAVECFAFVARDIRDQDKLLAMILKAIEKEGNGTIGCGRLFFEIIRGVNGHFHSIAQKFLKFIFESLLIGKYNTDILGEIVSITNQHILLNIHPNYMGLYWSALCESIETHAQSTNCGMLILLELMSNSTKYKKGKFLADLELLVPTVLKLLQNLETDELLEKCVTLISLILLSDAKISQLDTTRLFKQTLQISNRQIFENFIWSITDHPQFDILILPDFIKYFENYFDANTLELLAKICLKKSSLSTDGENFSEWKKYRIGFKKQETEKKFGTILDEYDNNLEQYLLAATILPHTSFENYVEKIEAFCEISILHLIKNSDINSGDDGEIQKNLFNLYINLESMLHVTTNLKSDTLLKKIAENIMKYCSNEKYIIALKILNIILKINNKLLTTSEFNNLHFILTNNLLSPNPEFRKLTALVLSYCCNNKNSAKIYKIFYNIDSIPSTVHTYREQTLLIDRVAPEGELIKLAGDNENIKNDCLKFLLGFLHINFKLLWDPVLKKVEEFFNALPIQNFWDIYKIKLEESADFIQKTANCNTELAETLKIFRIEILNDLFKSYHEEKEFKLKLDYENYRNLLWSKLTSFGQLTEVKNREIVTIFLKFVNEEYRKAHKAKILTWNILDDCDNIPIENEEDFELTMENQNIYELNNSMIENETKLDGKRRNSNNKFSKFNDSEYSIKKPVHTLCIKLKIFVKQANPKQLHRESELYEFYLELLSGLNPVLQRLALDCILAYKNKSITPYKDTLYKIIDEKEFRTELINFQTELILSQHRSEFMNIFLKILYGKMMTKSAAKQTLTNQIRKTIVLRFLGKCSKEEIFEFLKMSFRFYEGHLDDDLNRVPASIDAVFDLKTIWSAKKMQSSLNLLELIRKQFGGLMDNEFQLYFLKIIVFIGHACNRVIESASKIKNKLPIVYKNVKILALNSLINFFQHYENFEWSTEQIKTITEIYVWPNLEKLQYDSIHSPTPLMKLLCCWSYNSKNFRFLVQEKSNLVPFKSLIELMLNVKTKFTVRKAIMEIIERLLMVTSEGEISGIDVIKPYLQQILKRLKMNFSQKGAKRNLDKRDLNILSMLTEFVEDSNACDSLLQLLLPILIGRTQNGTEDVIEKVIITLSNLINKLHEPEIYVRKIAPLFEHINEVTARKMLCNILSNIGKNRPHLLETASIINELNSWDKRWIDQPDYDKRLNALKVVTEKLQNNEVDMNLGVLIIYNCFYFLKYDKDMGMRDNAAEHLKVLGPKLIQYYESDKKEVEYLIEEVLLNLVRRTIRDKNDNVRNEGILLLGVLAKKCSNSHQILKDLSLLVDEDSEVDFFENITHLQSVRHAKALLRFCSIIRNSNLKPNYKTLTQFILPLATRYLLNEKFSSKHTLIDPAIETIGIVCYLLPWQHYHAILKFYLQKLRYDHEYQKQHVRIVITILDAFHFDLTSAGGYRLKELEMISKTAANSEPKAKEPEEQVDEVEDIHEGDKQEDLDSELDEVEDNDDTECEPTTKKKKLDANYSRVIKLEANAAKKVVHTISTILIPTLNQSITQNTAYDTKHKFNRKRYSTEREEEEILRVPIALAIVKLLQKLPKEILSNSLNGVFMKVCTYLKSPLKSVRMLTRNILQKIMETLGSNYLSTIIELLTTLLTRGFQVHVLSVTVHGVLDCLKEQFQKGDLESCLKNILEVSLNDIFGEVSLEKEINKIASHTPEAKPSAKSYLTLYIAARNISESCLLDLLIPFKDYLAKSHSHKVVNKVQQCFQKIVAGLVENKNISIENQLIFIYGILSESIVDLLPGGVKVKLTENEKEKMRRARPDCFLITEAPRFRSGAITTRVKTNAQANAHVLIEFGLEMFGILLKRKKIQEISYQPFLNPLLPLLKESLKSSHIRVTTFTLNCFTAIWNGKYELKMKSILTETIQEIFKILHKYSTFGTTRKDDNSQLVNSGFKSIVALLRNCEEYNVDNDHINKLLFYIEQDVFETEKQPIAFSLLKAIVHRKVQIKEIHDIMQKICEISITSQSDFAREECRLILIFYLMEYPLSKKVTSILKFFITQLSYEVIAGRLSAAQFLEMIIRKFPQEILIEKSEFIFLSLGSRLVNDETPECRIAVADCVEKLLGRLDKDSKDKLFDITMTFLENDGKPAIREMGASLCSRFVSQEKAYFIGRIKTCLPILLNRLMLSNPKGPGRFVKVVNTTKTEDSIEDNNIKEITEQRKQRAIDHELIQIQNCILRILENCTIILQQSDSFSMVDELAYESQKLLGHEHEWVRLNSAKILSEIISTLDFDLIGKLILSHTEINESERQFLHCTPESDIKSLVLDLCAQLQPGETTEQLTEEVVKILLFMANILKVVPIKHEDSESSNDSKKLNLNWLLRRIRYVIYGEIAKAPHSCILRTSIFNWIEGLITIIDVQMIQDLAINILSPLVREMSEEDQNIDPILRQQAIRIGNKIRKKIGSDSYDKLRSNIQKHLMIKRALRRKEVAMEKINDPVRAARRKEGVQVRKKLAKKRKMDVKKGKIEGKKKKRYNKDEC